MAGLNKVMLIGNVGRDAEMRYTTSGKPVTTFSLAVNRTYSRDGERQDETEWFDIVTWDKLAETCNQFVNKGKQVYVEGRIHLRRWESQDGRQGAKNEVTATTVLFLDRQGAGTGSLPEGSFSDTRGDTSPDDLPF